jgi:hypothetical protein
VTGEFSARTYTHMRAEKQYNSAWLAPRKARAQISV